MLFVPLLELNNSSNSVLEGIRRVTPQSSPRKHEEDWRGEGFPHHEGRWNRRGVLLHHLKSFRMTRQEVSTLAIAQTRLHPSHLHLLLVCAHTRRYNHSFASRDDTHHYGWWHLLSWDKLVDVSRYTIQSCVVVKVNFPDWNLCDQKHILRQPSTAALVKSAR